MILVTGGTGLLGSHLLYDLVQTEEKVRALYRSDDKIEELKSIFRHYEFGQLIFDKIEWVKGDLLDIPSLAEAVRGVKQIYHCAAMVSFKKIDAKKILKTNIEGTANIVNEALKQGVQKLCYASSTAAVGHTNDKGELINENIAWKEDKQTSTYSISKHFAEREVWRGAEEGLETVIVNPSVIIGPGDWTKTSGSFFPTMWNGLKYYSLGGNAFVDVRDVASAMQKLMDSSIINERFLLVGENMSFRNFFNYVADALDVKRPWIKAGPIKTAIVWRIDLLRSFFTGKPRVITKETASSSQSLRFYSNQKIKNALNFTFTPISKTVVDTANVFLKNKNV